MNRLDDLSRSAALPPEPVRPAGGGLGWRLGGWTAIASLFLLVSVHFALREQRVIALNQARDSFRLDQAYRHWSAQTGTEAPPGMGPAQARPAAGYPSHLVSLAPMGREGVPDPWERQTLASLSAERPEAYTQASVHGAPVLRFLAALPAEEGCLRCHAHQGLRAGELLGGLSITVPLPGLAATLTQPHQAAFEAGVLGLWLLGLAGITLGHRRGAQLARAEARALRQLSASEARYRLISENAGDVIWLMDIDSQRITFVSPSVERVLGYSEQEVLGQSLMAFVTPESALEGTARLQVRVQALRAGAAGSRTETHLLDQVRRDGSIAPMEVRTTLLVDEDGAVTTLLGVSHDATERKLAHEALRASEELFSRVFSLSPDAINISRLHDGVYLEINEGFTNIVGYTREEILGRSSLDPRLQIWVDPGDRARLVAGLMATGTVTGMEALFRTKAGHQVTGLISARILEINGELGILSIIRDISDRKGIEEALKVSEARYRTQFNLASAGILTHTVEGRVLECNEAFAAMHGRTVAEVRCMALGELLAGPFPADPERMGRILEGAAITFEVDHLHRDGHPFPVEVSASLIRAGGEAHILAFHRDITSRKRDERERAQLMAQLQHAQKMDCLGNLAGGVAHDMNNVLGAILALATVHLESQAANGSSRHAFEIIAQAADRGGAMVKSLLNFARKKPAEMREVDLNGIIQEEVALLAHTTLAKVRIATQLADGLGLVRGDASALANALMNLCVNAVDAMAGKGTLTLRTRNADEGWVEVQVEDDGCGMAPEILDRALEPFFSTKEVGLGTGLGLAMVYSTVKAHEGELTLRSTPGQGTCVTLRLPTCAPAPAPAPGRAQATPSRHRPLAILLVDDDPLVLDATQEVLVMLGHRVTVAPCGEAALALVDAGLRPDLVILDMNMPGLGGHGTVAPLRARCPLVPVILATGRVDQSALDLVEAHPHLTLLPKPFRLHQIQRQIEDLVPGTPPLANP